VILVSGGHYSLYRGALGVFALALFARTLPGLEQPWEIALAVTGCAAAVPFAIGYRDRAFAVVLGALFVVVLRPDPFTAVLLTAPLALDITLRTPPYGAWDARGRSDPDGGFTFPRAMLMLRVPFAGLGALRAAALVSADGLDAIDTVLVAGTIAFLVSAPFDAARRWGFVALLVAVSTEIALRDEPWSLPLLFVVLATFDPRFVPRAPRPTERVFYDGACGLCHRAVRFVLAEDRAGDAFRFAALHGETFEKELSVEKRAGLPDSIVVLTHDGEVLVRSRAIFRMMERLGGAWRVLALLGRIVPRPVADAVYDGIARVRHRLFAKPADVCPLIPKSLRPRFDP
jgi:predicted DCC family thiol-disulfide oxidoreductase YuxK